MYIPLLWFMVSYPQTCLSLLLLNWPVCLACMRFFTQKLFKTHYETMVSCQRLYKTPCTSRSKILFPVGCSMRQCGINIWKVKTEHSELTSSLLTLHRHRSSTRSTITLGWSNRFISSEILRFILSNILSFSSSVGRQFRLYNSALLQFFSPSMFHKPNEVAVTTGWSCIERKKPWRIRSKGHTGERATVL